MDFFGANFRGHRLAASLVEECIEPLVKGRVIKKKDKNDMMYGELHTEAHVVVMCVDADEQVLSTTTPHIDTTVVAIHTSYTKCLSVKNISLWE